MSWVRAVSADLFPEGARKTVEIKGHTILIIHEEGRIYALVSACPHMRLPLKRGKVQAGTITCPWHHSAFDLETGDVKEWSPWPPGVGKMLGALSREKALAVFPTKVEDGSVWVNVHDPD